MSHTPSRSPSLEGPAAASCLPECFMAGIEPCTRSAPPAMAEVLMKFLRVIVSFIFARLSDSWAKVVQCEASGCNKFTEDCASFTENEDLSPSVPG